jgi:hypothetical protein
MVLNTRIMTHLEDTQQLHDGQQGFRPGRSAVDNIYMLKTCLDARCQQKLDTYLLFVDIEKAYDTVWRDGLLWHLWNKGIHGKMFRVLAQMLDDTRACVMHNGCFSREMHPDMGWEQGDTLATTMFNVFIDSVLHQVWQEHEGIPIPACAHAPDTKLTALLYADDLVGATATQEAMQRLIESTRKALNKWQLRASVNPTDMSKTAVMKVLGGPKSVRQSIARRNAPSTDIYYWGDIVIPQVKRYKYLGVWVNDSNTWHEHLTLRMKSADKAATSHHKVLTQVKLPVHLRKLTMTTVVQPNLSYASQVWANPTQTTREMLDSWQMSLFARSFHCPSNTSHICLQQELGLFPMHVTCEKLALRYWHHLENTPTDRLLHQVHSAWGGKHHPWKQNMQKLLTQYNIDVQTAKPMAQNEFRALVDKQAIQYLKSHWEKTRREDGVHSRYLATFDVGTLTETRPKTRKYLHTMTQQPDANSCRAAELCMLLRLECLPLNAMRRYNRRNETAAAAAKIQRELCPGCKAQPETPTHFMLECPAYAALRSHR